MNSKKVAWRLHFVLLFRITAKISQPNRKSPPRESQVDFSTPLRCFFALTCTKCRPQAVLSASGTSKSHPRTSRMLPIMTPRLQNASQNDPKRTPNRFPGALLFRQQLGELVQPKNGLQNGRSRRRRKADDSFACRFQRSSPAVSPALRAQ